MAKAKKGSAGAKRPKSAASVATKHPRPEPKPAPAAKPGGAKSAAPVKAAVPPAKAAPPAAKKASVPPKPTATSKSPAPKGAPPPKGAPTTDGKAKSSAIATAKNGKNVKNVDKNVDSKDRLVAATKAGREKQNVKDAGTAKGTDAKGAAKGKGAAGKKVVLPPPPPRKIQVVQMSTLKPGARGSKATVVRAQPLPGERAVDGVMKKRRSAELTAQQLDHFKELLMQRRSRLAHDLNLMQDEALKVTAQDNSSDSVADTGTDNYEQDFTLGLIESEEALAREVDGALLRIEQMEFGVCESCQTPIPLARLEILPFSRCCVECQQKREGAPS
jgi:RNA polymerase-binding protein DksA